MENSRSGWILSGILGIIVVVLLIILMGYWNADDRELGNVLEQGEANLAEVRAEVGEKCTGPQGTNSTACQDALDELSDVLQEFSEDLETATTTPDGV